MALSLTCTDRSGREREVRAAPEGLRRLLTVLSPVGPTGLSDVRALLVADVLARLVEDLHGGQILTAVTTGGAPSGLARVIDAFGIRPPAVVAGATAAAVAQLGGAARLSILAADAPGPEDDRSGEGAGYLLRVGGVIATGNAREILIPADGQRLTEEIDPLAVRLALLDAERRRPVTLADGELEQAAATLVRWRRTVAAWAASPSCPIPTGISERMRAALDHDLDVPALLLLLNQLEADTDVAPGAKFETFVYADRVLGLGLAREVGRVHPPPPGIRKAH